MTRVFKSLQEAFPGQADDMEDWLGDRVRAILDSDVFVPARLAAGELLLGELQPAAPGSRRSVLAAPWPVGPDFCTDLAIVVESQDGLDHRTIGIRRDEREWRVLWVRTVEAPFTDASSPPGSFFATVSRKEIRMVIFEILG